MSTPTRLSPEAAAHALRSITLPDVFGPDEIANRLGTPRSAVVRALREGVIPGQRIGRRWAISRTAFLAWLASPEPREPDPPHLQHIDGGGER